MRSILNNSYTTLPPAEQRLFRLLAVQPTTEIDVHAASALDGRPPAETRRSLDILANTHLLDRPDAADKYKIHDLLHAYAAHHLAHGPPAECRAAERRLLSFWLQSAINALHQVTPNVGAAPPIPLEPGVEPLKFDDESTAANWIVAERHTIIAIIRFGADRRHHDFAWRIPHAVTPIFDRRGYYQDSRDALTIAVVCARHSADAVDEAASLCDLGLVHLNLGEHHAARRCLNKALDLLTEDNVLGQAATRHTLARLDILEERMEEGISQFEHVLELARSARDSTLQCWTHYRLGDALCRMGRYDQALLHLHRAHTFSVEIGEEPARAQSLIAMGTIHRELGDFRMAEACCREALTLTERTEDLASTVLACMGLAELHKIREEYSTARDYAQRAVEFADRARSTERLAHALDILASCHRALGDQNLARQAWEKALRLHDDLGQPRAAQRVWSQLAQLPPF